MIDGRFGDLEQTVTLLLFLLLSIGVLGTMEIFYLKKDRKLRWFALLGWLVFSAVVIGRMEVIF